MRRSTQLERTAYHEAGHAVAAVRLGIGIDFDGVTIVPSATYHGIVRAANGLQWAPEYDGAVFCLAGEAAQNVFAPRSCSPYRDSFKDRVDFAKWLKHHGHNEGQYSKLEWKYTRAAYAFVRQHWSDVDRVALALFERQTLCGPDVHQVMSEVDEKVKNTHKTASFAY